MTETSDLRKHQSSSDEPSDAVLSAAFVGKNASYYLRVFDILQAKRSVLSWNWAAFFLGWAWLLYRKLWIWALLVSWLAAYLIALLAFAIAYLNPYVAIVVYVAGFFWPAYLGHWIYYRKARRVIAESRRSARTSDFIEGQISGQGGTSSAGVVVAVFVGIAMLGMMLAIAIPAYHDYAIRARVSEALMTLTAAKILVSEHRIKTGEFPDDSDEIGLQVPDDLPHYAELYLSADGVLIVDFDPALMELFGHGPLQAVLVPELRDGAVHWECFSGETAETLMVYLPSSCRD